MNISVLVDRAKERVKARFGQKPVIQSRPDVSQIISLIDAEQALVYAGEAADNFVKTPFYAVFEEAMRCKLDAAHESLLKGEISPDEYRGTYKVLRDVMLYAPSTVERGKKASDQMAEWRSDGTLEEAELWRSGRKE